jgi:drug/metabolite transporter (DMT)-like permease
VSTGVAGAALESGPPRATSGEARGTAGMVLATLLWGGTFVVLRDALTHIAPMALVCARFAAAAVLIGLLLLARGRVPSRVELLGGVLTGALTGAGYLFQAIGLTTISAGTSAFLTCAGTLTAGLFAWPLLGQRPSPVLALGLLMAAVGSFLIAGRVDLALGSGEAWTLLGAIAYGLQIVAVARFVAHAHPLTLAGIQALTVALLVAPFAGRHLATLSALPAADLWRLGYLVVAGSVIAPWLQVVAQRSLSPGRVGLLFALEPVFAVVFAVALGGERFAPHWWWGAALILCAVTWVEVWAARRSASSRRASA